MCILKGFNTTLAKTSTNSFPFGLWFANPDTLYVADEGNGTNTFAGRPVHRGRRADHRRPAEVGLRRRAGVEAGLHAAGGPEPRPALHRAAATRPGDNAATGLPWAPATDGLRNITGRVNRDGTVTIWAITSTVSGSGDQGADPNKLVEITDPLAATAPAAGESFRTVRTAGFGEVLRGVSFTPGTW